MAHAALPVDGKDHVWLASCLAILMDAGQDDEAPLLRAKPIRCLVCVSVSCTDLLSSDKFGGCIEIEIVALSSRDASFPK